MTIDRHPHLDRITTGTTDDIDVAVWEDILLHFNSSHRRNRMADGAHRQLAERIKAHIEAGRLPRDAGIQFLGQLHREINATDLEEREIESERVMLRSRIAELVRVDLLSGNE